MKFLRVKVVYKAELAGRDTLSQFKNNYFAEM